MQSDDLAKAVFICLTDFYNRRLQKLADLRLKEALRKKNPYLFRAVGVNKASEIVEGLLQAYMSSSEETIFGDAFFEPLVRTICSGHPSGGAGVDVELDEEDTYTAISVKSGPNWGNSSQMSKLRDDFRAARLRFDNKKLKKTFRALLGHCYGRKASDPEGKRAYYVRSGQAFWEEITGDADFYLKIITLMDGYPTAHRRKYDKEWAKAANRFTKEFLNDFATEDGSIDWEKLVRFNSGVKGGKK